MRIDADLKTPGTDTNEVHTVEFFSFEPHPFERSYHYLIPFGCNSAYPGSRTKYLNSDRVQQVFNLFRQLSEPVPELGGNRFYFIGIIQVRQLLVHVQSR